MTYYADFHIHSRFARATSHNLTLPVLDEFAHKKGVKVLGTGDFTHPQWFAEIKHHLTAAPEPGLLVMKNAKNDEATRFILSSEISSIYSQGGKNRRIHTIVMLPEVEAVETFNGLLAARGAKLSSDGRPIIGMSAKELLKICLEINENHLTIPAHIWTPWFALFGSKSGFDSIEECYEELTPYIHAVETGLSSDPAMNWRISNLDQVMLVSNSDAHSLENLGREANVWDLTEPSFPEIYKMFKTRDKKKFLYTIEFFPEEGMYHIDGHRDCDFSCLPEQTKKLNNLCPKCKKFLTIGVMNRVDNLSDKKIKDINSFDFVPYKSIVLLRSIIADALGVGKQAKQVQQFYQQMIKYGQSEFNVLLNLTEEEISQISSLTIAQGITRVRNKTLELIPGFDGRYGQIKIFENSEKIKFKQISLF